MATKFTPQQLDEGLKRGLAAGYYKPGAFVDYKNNTIVQGPLTTQSPTDFGGTVYDPKNQPPALPPDKTAEDIAGSFNPELFSKIRSSLGEAPQISTTPVAPQLADQLRPTPIQGLGSDFFTNERNRIKEDLRAEFFGPVGDLQQVASQESAAGRFGSGVGERVIQETAIKPFLQELSKVDNTILQAQAQETARVESFNAQQFNQFQNMMATLASQDAANALTAAQANAKFQADYVDLAGRLADAEAGRLSDAEVALLDSDTRVYIAAMDAYTKSQALAQEAQRDVEIARHNRAAEYQEDIKNRLAGVQTFGQFKPETAQAREIASALPSEFGGGFPTDSGGNVEALPQSELIQAEGLPERGRRNGEIAQGASGRIYQWDEATQRWR